MVSTKLKMKKERDSPEMYFIFPSEEIKWTLFGSYLLIVKQSVSTWPHYVGVEAWNCVYIQVSEISEPHIFPKANTQDYYIIWLTQVFS